MTDWPTEGEIKAMFPRKEGFGADVTLSAAMELPEVRALVEALENMTGAFDTPIARRKMSGEMSDEARTSARAALAPFTEAKP